MSLAQDAPSLEIQPGGSDLRRDLGTTGSFTCRPSQKGELIRDLVWVDPRGREVPDERTGRSVSGGGGLWDDEKGGTIEGVP